MVVRLVASMQIAVSDTVLRVPHVIELRGGHACGSPDRESRSRQRGARRPAQVQWRLRWLRRLRLRQLTLLCLTLVAGRQPFSGGAGTGYQKGSTAAATLPVRRGGGCTTGSCREQKRNYSRSYRFHQKQYITELEAERYMPAVTRYTWHHMHPHPLLHETT